ncbi:MAG: hypothetical protein IJ003_04755 [Candidatus Gastranaerophilales bacterium]|nr:hypothetical protein [Candidatus Gastranaerophilales bacterium]
MKKCIKKLIGFTIAEAMVVMVIIGIIAAMCVPGIFVNNKQNERVTMGKKIVTYLDDAALNIIINNAVLDDFTRLKDKEGYFSVEDKDIAPRFSRLIREYMLEVNLAMDLSREYFSNEILDYDKTSTGEKLKDAYSGFFYANDGVIIGFRFYESCSATEKNANPPEFEGRYEVQNACGSAFFDVNAYQRPNKLGSDQFIIPIYKRGFKYDNE